MASKAQERFEEEVKRLVKLVDVKLATVTFTPLGLWVRKIANMSYEMSRGEGGLTEAL